MNRYGNIIIHDDGTVTIRWPQFDLEDRYASIKEMRQHFKYPPELSEWEE